MFKNTVLGLCLFAGMTFVAARSKAADTNPAPAAHGKLVFALSTGMEDMQTLNMAIRHSKAAKESGYLEDVVLLVYGRAVQAFNAGMGQGARPPQLASMAREAQKAGVKIVLCGNSIEQMGISKDKLDPKPNEIVPNAIYKLSELIASGYQVIKY